MAIISDGTTDITIEFVDEKIEPEIEESVRRTAGGVLRRITGGERLMLKIEARVTSAEYRSILNLLTNNASTYFYTPEQYTESWFTDLYPDTTIPIAVTYKGIKKVWDNRRKWYVSITLMSNEYV